MIFTETNLKGAFIIDLEKRSDERGFFARTFCANEFEKHNLKTVMPQSNMSLSIPKYTLRGMHYQIDGAEEAKLIRCTKGKIMDVIIDIRKGSSTYCQHIKVELSDQNYRMLYVPEGFAHGFITLEENCEVSYQVSQFYTPGKEKGIRWNDPLFGINWPILQPVLSEKDATHPDYIP
ncbi:MAG: dTDP-4-dehydrorhamnose 3,5-epimerase [Bacteroidota bacterium]|nr:dTDP-4-dehydrorhamnose 3,5-epimerase [Bacteroidota bacterium]